MAAIPARELFIDGRWVAPSTGRYLDVINPATEEVIGRIPAAAEADVNAAVAAANAAHKRGAWGKLTGKQRAETLRTIAQKVCARTRGWRTHLTGSFHARGCMQLHAPCPCLRAPGRKQTHARMPACTCTCARLGPPHSHRSATARAIWRGGRRWTWASPSTRPIGTWCAVARPAHGVARAAEHHGIRVAALAASRGEAPHTRQPRGAPAGELRPAPRASHTQAPTPPAKPSHTPLHHRAPLPLPQDDVATCFDYYAGLAEKLDERQYSPVDVGMEEFSVKVGGAWMEGAVGEGLEVEL